MLVRMASLLLAVSAVNVAIVMTVVVLHVVASVLSALLVLRQPLKLLQKLRWSLLHKIEFFR
jgi:hypothetical protein